MNSVIAAASSGLLIALLNQYSNVFIDEAKVQDEQILYNYNVH